ncbi:hypothetical protein ACIBTP_39755 [Streptomyces avidinii]|uniref:hypothetical protein n=1 Tax=Streptomyces avidinii TaxID=1895 RepID=UPI00378E54D7
MITQPMLPHAGPEVTTEPCRAPGDTVLTCLRDLDVLDEPLEARIGIAPDVALLVQRGAAVGRSLTAPVRYLTRGFAAPDHDLRDQREDHGDR